MYCGEKQKKQNIKNAEETKYQKAELRNNKDMEMRNVKQMSKQEEIRVCYERRQVGRTEKVEKKTRNKCH